MKKNIFAILLVISMIFLFSTTDLYSVRRGCTGSKSCTACSSCSGCKHCAKQGGTCGVCYTPPKKETKEKSNLDSLENDTLITKKKKATIQ